MLDARTPLLAIKDLQAWYGESHILHGVLVRSFAFGVASSGFEGGIKGRPALDLGATGRDCRRDPLPRL